MASTPTARRPVLAGAALAAALVATLVGCGVEGGRPADPGPTFAPDAPGTETPTSEAPDTTTDASPIVWASVTDGGVEELWADEEVIVVYGDSLLAAFQRADGRHRWAFEVDDAGIDLTRSADGSVIGIDAGLGSVAGVDVATGALDDAPPGLEPWDPVEPAAPLPDGFELTDGQLLDGGIPIWDTDAGEGELAVARLGALTAISDWYAGVVVLGPGGERRGSILAGSPDYDPAPFWPIGDELLTATANGTLVLLAPP